MAAFGPNSPGTMADDTTVGTLAWTSLDGAKVSDNSYAAVDLGVDATSHYLKATNFSFSIPTGATINGILVEIERFEDKGNADDVVKDSVVSIVKADGTIGTTNKADTVTEWPITDTYKSYGSSSDSWNETWTAENINDIDFGMVISASAVSGPIANVDHIRITVYYTESGVIPSPNISQAITVTDTPTLFFPTLTISVSESITVTESIKGGLVDPNVSESITLTESIVMNLINMPKISDTVTITESTDFAFNPLLINVSEAITITETIVMQGLNISESITLTENVVMDLEMKVNVSESITVTDTESTRLVSFPSSTNWTKGSTNSTDWEEQPE